MQGRLHRSLAIRSAAVAGIGALAALFAGGTPVPGVQADVCMVSGITASPATGQTNQPTTFTATFTGCTPAQQQAGTYVWSFGDGATGTTNPAPHTYTAANTYNVVLQASGMVSGTVSQSYTVGQGLTVTTNGPYTGVINQPISMSVATTGFPADTVVTWNFGDGTSSTGAAVTKTYSSTGQFSIMVMATSQSTGRTGTATTMATISATAPTTITLSNGSPTTAQVGTAVTLSVTPSAAPPADYTYLWNFGDGSQQTAGSSVSHTYANTGNFTVTVSATSAGTPSANAQTSWNIVVSQASQPQPTGPTVTYSAGWNLVAGPAGTVFTGASGPLYTYQASDSAYQILSGTTAATSGVGYWAFYDTSKTVTLNGAGASNATITAPASHWIMVGNPSGTTSVTVRGADVVYIWSPAANQYTQSTTLQPGQGAWAISLNGGTITVGP